MKRERSKWKTHKDLSTKARPSDGLTCSSDEINESRWSKGVGLSVLLFSQPRDWEELK